MADWGSIAKDVAKAAPILGNLLPGVGTVAGIGVGAVASIVASALGVPADPDSVATALQNDPDAYVKLKTAELDNKAKLAELSITQENNRALAANAQYASEAADRDSARKLAAATPRDFMRPMLAIALMLMTAYIIWAIFGGHADSVIKDTTAALTVGTLIGYVLSENKQVLGFYFGMTRDATLTNAKVADFATSPGSVTSEPTKTTVSVASNPPVQVATDTSNVYRGS